jgi:hypothetical protein
MGNAYNILIRKHEEMRSLQRRKSRWEYNIKINLKEIRCKDMGRIQWVQYRVQW